MKKWTLILALFFTGISLSYAQRIAYIDSEFIMDQIPEYQAAQDEIDRISQKWQEELEGKYRSIEQMYSEYTAGEVLMTEDTKRDKQEAIFAAEREAKEYREKKFGYSGELFELQESKVNPLQEKVFKAVETVAKRKKYDYVFDKSGEVTWLFTNSTYDLSQLVLEELGIYQDDDSGR
ncbi:MAG: OmpH family outer membrane protein [Bacteroidota bacterium]